MGNISYQTYRSHERRVAESDANFMLLGSANQLFAQIEGAESAKRGYLLTRRKSYLERYRDITGSLDQEFAAMRPITGAIPNGADRIARLRVLIDSKVAEMNETLARFEDSGLTPALRVMEADNARNHVDQIRAELAATIADAERAREARRDASLLEAKRTNLIIALGASSMFLLLAFATFLIERDQQLQRRYLADIHELNQTLEHRVSDRTQALQETNRALEAFSYSVSHDLRAPLRSVNGFAKILARDYKGRTLDERASDLMTRMCESTVRMGQLIDDLLTLSRISRGGIQPSLFNLSEVAQSIVEQLRAQEPGRNVEVTIQPEMRVLGDARLMRVALENLFGNAWKFTRPKSPALIAFGRDAAQSAFFIRDNGVGFDMEYARQLFVPFQRLHRDSEFEGTGIGLATVERVIHSHGGRIWADSHPDAGAAFYFTLETERRSNLEEISVGIAGGGQSGRRAAHA